MYPQKQHGILTQEGKWKVSSANKACLAVSIRRTSLIILSVFFFLSVSACTRSASQNPVQTPTGSQESITVRQVQVIDGTGIYVTGQSTLADKECVQTELLVDQKPAAWWPDVCIEVASGQWELLVGLGKNGAPAQLKAGSSYVLHAWWPKQPAQSSTHFPFDLDRP